MSNLVNKIEKKFVQLQFTTAVRLGLYRKIASFLNQGVSLDDTLKNLSKQYKKLNKNDVRVLAIDDWLSRMDKGDAFSQALKGWSPSSEIMLLRSGETGDSLVEAFESAITGTEAIKRIKDTLVAQSTYPLILLIALFGIILFYAFTVIPELALLDDPENWPSSPRAFHDMSMFVKDYYYIVFSILGILAIVVSTSMGRFTGFLRKYFDKMPPWSIYKSFQSSVFLISLSAMLRSGIPLLTAIEELSSQSGKYTKSFMDKMIVDMKRSMSNGEVLNNGFLDTEIGIDVEIFSETSDFATAMDEVGREAIEVSIKKITAGTSTMRNLVLIGVAGYLGWSFTSIRELTTSIAQQVGL